MQPPNAVIALTAEIEREFGFLSRPIGVDLAPHDCPECDGVRERLSGRFDEISDESMNWLADCLPLLGPRGLQYYLPAYLLKVLRDPRWHGIDLLLAHLNPGNVDEDYWAPRIAVFSEGQRRVLVRFLEWMRSTEYGAHFAEDLEVARELWKQAA